MAPPRVEEAALAFECKLEHLHPILDSAGKATATMVVARVVMVHANRHVLDSEKQTVLADRLLPLSRLGGNDYACTREVFTIARPRV